MGSLQGAELQQGLKPADLELSLGEQRGWVTGKTGPRMGSQQDLGSAGAGQGAWRGQGVQRVKRDKTLSRGAEGRGNCLELKSSTQSGSWAGGVCTPWSTWVGPQPQAQLQPQPQPVVSPVTAWAGCGGTGPHSSAPRLSPGPPEPEQTQEMV